MSRHEGQKQVQRIHLNVYWHLLVPLRPLASVPPGETFTTYFFKVIAVHEYIIKRHILSGDYNEHQATTIRFLCIIVCIVESSVITSTHL